MTWVKLDDGFPRHPKLIGLPADVKWAYIEALCYCGQYLTDGLFPAEGVIARKHADRLCKAGLVDVEDGQYLIHDYLHYNPSRVEVEAEREKKRAAGKAGGRASARARAQAHAEPPASDVLEELPNPVPSRPVPVGESQSSAVAAKRRDAMYEVLISDDSVAADLRRKLISRQPEWGRLNDKALLKLGHDFGPETVIAALGRIYETPPLPEEPYPYLLTICRRIEERGVA